MRSRARTILAALDPEVVKEIRRRLRPVRPREYGAVYVVEFGDYVKIGWSTDVHKRVASLRRAHELRPADLTGTPELIAVIPGDQSTERALLLAFAAQRAIGEWFYRRDAMGAWATVLRNDDRWQRSTLRSRVYPTGIAVGF